MNVKTLFIGLASAWIACTMCVFGADDGWAPLANQVSFRVRTKVNASPINAIGSAEAVPAAGDLFKVKDTEAGKAEGGKPAWCVVNVPVQVYAAGRDRKTEKLAPARYIRKLHVDVYLLIRKPIGALKGGADPRGTGAENFYLLKKGMDLVDIPMRRTSFKEGSKELGIATFNIGVFIPRSTAYILTDDFTDPIGELQKRGVLVGYAAEASFNGEKCREYLPSKEQSSMLPGCTVYSKLLDTSLVSKYGDLHWWTTRSKDNFDVPDVDVLCISETPFAMYYGRYYPRTTPTYGAPEKPDEGDATGKDEEEDDSTSGSETKKSSSSHKSSSHKESSSEKKSDYDNAL